MDIVLALDASGRTSRENWETVIQFCKEFVKDMQPVSSRENRIGILTFDERPRTVKELSARTEIKDVEKVVDGLRKTQLSGMTFTDEALREVLNVFAKGKGIRESHKVLIVFYDGKTTDRRGKKGDILNRDPISKLRHEDVQTFAVEFGPFVGEEDVLSVVSEPKLEHIYTLNDLPELLTAVKKAAWRVCAKIK